MEEWEIISNTRTKLTSIYDDFKSRLLPLCQQFLDKLSSEGNTEQLVSEHATLSAAVKQQVVAVLYSVGTDEWAFVRGTRRRFLKEVQQVLHEMDIKLQSIQVKKE